VWESHKEHGKQFRVVSFRALLPSTISGIIKYLSSGVIAGCGVKTAERIVKAFGERTLDILDNYSSRLGEVEGIGKNKAKQIKACWDELKSHRELDIFLQSMNVTPGNCRKLRDYYGALTAKVISETPYRIAEVSGIGFLTADRIAMAQGMSKESPVRLAAGLIYSLKELGGLGHSCYPEDLLVPYAGELLRVECGLIEQVLPVALGLGTIVRSEIDFVNYIYLKGDYQAEVELAEKIAYLSSVPEVKRSNQRQLEIGGSFTRGQKQAIENAFKNRISIITGGPGVGKTTVVSEIVRNAKNRNMKVMLAAPTGRAAKRMSEACKHMGLTIHRLLRWDAHGKKFAFDEETPLDCDLLVVDEVSMLDLSLARYLLRSVSLRSSLVLVGDSDQLPSVGAGNVLHDLISSGVLACTHLDEVFRQASGSKIIVNAHLVNKCKMPILENPVKGELGDFYWIKQEDPEKVNELILEMLCKRIPERFGFNPYSDVQVLTPMNNGVCGTVNLNKIIQSRLNPGGNREEFSSGERVFRLHDKVMQRVNNYDKNVFNGDSGFICSIDLSNKKFEVEYDDRKVEYELADADQIMLAYAVTVHKSQGSEFPCIIMPLLTQHYAMLQKNLIYTGMTRAKKLLILIGTEKALRLSISNDKQQQRFSNLGFRLRASNLLTKEI
ncbi:MAG: SF1B family DNA helicase RecD2, partial [Lentisphaeria bacterium]